MTDFALLHGGGQGSWVWDDTATALRGRGATLLALDVPGCGTKRGRNTADLSLDDIAAELMAEIRATGVTDTVLVGHSLAGSLLPRMAELAGGGIGRLVYLSCSAPLPGVTFGGQMGSGRHGDHPDEVGWSVDPQRNPLERRYRAMFCNDMDEAMAERFLAKLGQDHWPTDVFRRSDWRYDHLGAVPSTYILCEQDQSLPPEWQERFAERLLCGRIVRFEAGHQAMITRPGELADLLLALD